MKLYTFGDSHSHMGWNFFIPNLEIIHGKTNTYTMSRFSFEKLNLINIKKEGVNEGDIVCFCFGEIDCRSHLCKPHNFVDYKGFIDDIVKNYMIAIKLNAKQYTSIKILIYNIVPPYQIQSEDAYQDKEFPFIGSNEDRKTVALYMNNKLKEECNNYGYVFFDIYEKYCDINGFMNKDLCTDKVHIKNGVYIKEFLNNLINYG